MSLGNNPEAEVANHQKEHEIGQVEAENVQVAVGNIQEELVNTVADIGEDTAEDTVGDIQEAAWEIAEYRPGPIQQPSIYPQLQAK